MRNKKFIWHEYDITEKLPLGWADDINKVAKKHEKLVALLPTSITSREKNKNLKIETLVIDGEIIKENLSWLYELYLGLFKDIGQQCVDEALITAKNPLYAINLNIQRGSKMRYECHVDSNPLQGLLYVTSHPKGTGGELVVSNREEAIGEEEIENDSEKIYPIKGHLIFFDARKHPHFVKQLLNDSDERISVAMNFYTTSSPEDHRPIDLNSHLFDNNKQI